MNWIKKHKILTGVIAFFLLVGIVGAAGGDKQQTVNTASKAPQTAQKAADTPKQAQPTQVTQTTQPTKSKFQTLKDLTGTDATLFVANSTDLKEGTSEADAPFKVVINHTNATDCSAAKLASYDTIKSLYTNNDAKSLVDQVVITYPNTLVTSLSGDDGRSTSSWSGQTNFYKVMTDSFKVSQRDPAGQKTWVVLLKNCQ